MVAKYSGTMGNMNQAQATAPERVDSTRIEAPDLSLSETLRVLEVAREFRQKRSEAEVAIARSEIRELMRRRLIEAAKVTGDQVSEADIDVAIEQYFHRMYAYQDPPMSFSVVLAHLYVQRTKIVMVVGAVATLVLAYGGWLFFS